MAWGDEVVNYESLTGQKIVSVVGLEKGSDSVIFRMEDGRTLLMYHSQDCCESVSIEDIVGDPSDLNDAVILSAREEVGEADPEGYQRPEDSYRDESFTWTFYIFQTNKGAVTIRWLGESSGYYSESVDFVVAK